MITASPGNVHARGSQFFPQSLNIGQGAVQNSIPLIVSGGQTYQPFEARKSFHAPQQYQIMPVQPVPLPSAKIEVPQDSNRISELEARIRFLEEERNSLQLLVEEKNKMIHNLREQPAKDVEIFQVNQRNRTLEAENANMKEQLIDCKTVIDDMRKKIQSYEVADFDVKRLHEKIAQLELHSAQVHAQLDFLKTRPPVMQIQQTSSPQAEHKLILCFAELDRLHKILKNRLEEVHYLKKKYQDSEDKRIDAEKQLVLLATRIEVQRIQETTQLASKIAQHQDTQNRY